MAKSIRMTRSAHIELSKAGALAHTWGYLGMARALVSRSCCRIPDGAARYQFPNVIPIRLIAVSFYWRLPIGAVAAISSWRLS
jgi:hypothetical protein